jgi:flagellar protein FliO/FliZ
MLNFLLNTVTAPQSEIAKEMHNIQTPSFMRLGLAFLGLMAALWLVIWLLKKMSGSKMGFFHHDSSIKIIERKGLSPKTVLYIVEFNGQKKLIAESSLHIKIKDVSDIADDD